MVFEDSIAPLNRDFRDPNPSRLEGLTHEYGLAA
jgi:hypothetical protein